MCNIVWFSFLTAGSESLEIFKGKKNVEVGLIKIVLEAWFFFFFFFKFNVLFVRMAPK